MTNEHLAEIERRADPMRLENTIDDIAALLAEVRRLQAQANQHIADLTDEDDRVRALCARVLPQKDIDGDSYCVPGVVELCEMLVIRVESTNAMQHETTP